MEIYIKKEKMMEEELDLKEMIMLFWNKKVKIFLIVAIFITLSSFSLISTSFLAFLSYLVIGNVIARVGYELFLVLLVICRNTTEISKKLDKRD